MMIDAEDLVIRKEIHVNVPVERAFEVFTAGLQDWWPMETHSFRKGVISVDWRVGGLAVETAGGERFEWADVLEYEPPSALRLRWRVNPEKPPTEVAVSVLRRGRRDTGRAHPRRLGELRRPRRRGVPGLHERLGRGARPIRVEGRRLRARRSAGTAILPALRLRSPECLATGPSASRSWAPPSSAPLPPATPRAAPAPSGAGSSWGASSCSRSS